MHNRVLKRALEGNKNIRGGNINISVSTAVFGGSWRSTILLNFFGYLQFLFAWGCAKAQECEDVEPHFDIHWPIFFLYPSPMLWPKSIYFLQIYVHNYLSVVQSIKVLWQVTSSCSNNSVLATYVQFWIRSSRFIYLQTLWCQLEIWVSKGTWSIWLYII